MSRHTHVLSSILFMVFFLLVNLKNLEFSSSDSLNLHEVGIERSFWSFLLVNPKNIEFSSSDSLKLWRSIEHSF